jgi:hypothetical protein
MDTLEIIEARGVSPSSLHHRVARVGRPRPIELDRHCEERSDEATQGRRDATPGLLRCARDDDVILSDQFRERKRQGGGEAVRNRRTGARSPVRAVDL